MSSRKKFQNISLGSAPVTVFLAVFSFLLYGSDRFLGLKVPSAEFEEITVVGFCSILSVFCESMEI